MDVKLDAHWGDYEDHRAKEVPRKVVLRKVGERMTGFTGADQRWFADVLLPGEQTWFTLASVVGEDGAKLILAWTEIRGNTDRRIEQTYRVTRRRRPDADEDSHAPEDFFYRARRVRRVEREIPSQE